MAQFHDTPDEKGLEFSPGNIPECSQSSATLIKTGVVTGRLTQRLSTEISDTEVSNKEVSNKEVSGTKTRDTKARGTEARSTDNSDKLKVARSQIEQPSAHPIRAESPSRRRFVGASISGLLGFSAISAFHPVLANSSYFSEGQQNLEHIVTRLSAQGIEALQLVAPMRTVTLPQGSAYTLPRRAALGRRYAGYNYIWFENETQLRVYDDTGAAWSTINLPPEAQNLSDFALDGEGQIYLIIRGQHEVNRLSPSGNVLGVLGGFSISSVSGLNGPKSLTVDGVGNVHVLDAGSRSIKVFSAQSGYVKSYGHESWQTAQQPRSLDGISQIRASFAAAPKNPGGISRAGVGHSPNVESNLRTNESGWKFNVSGAPM